MAGPRSTRRCGGRGEGATEGGEGRQGGDRAGGTQWGAMGAMGAIDAARTREWFFVLRMSTDLIRLTRLMGAIDTSEVRLMRLIPQVTE